MASIDTALNHHQVEDLIEDISAATPVLQSAALITFNLSYTGDDLPHASTLDFVGSFTLDAGVATDGTVTSLVFRDGANAAMLSVTGLSLSYADASSLLSNPNTFSAYIESLDEHPGGHHHAHMGGDDDDSLSGGGSDDVMLGGDGDDELSGGRGDDDLFGGDGDDDLSGGLGDDLIDGGGGLDDRIAFSAAKRVSVDLAAGTARGEGNDTVLNIENVDGTRGNDRISGDDADNELDGGAGNDHLFGLNGVDLLTGGKGNDHLDGGDGDDVLDGGEGNDRLLGGAGNDAISGGKGNDNIGAGEGLNEVHAGSGNDKVVSGDDADLLYGDEGNDTLMSGGGDDQLFGGSGKDTIKAGDGNDLIDGGAGEDLLAGGAGDDTYVVSGSKDKIIEKAGEGNDTVQSSGSFSLTKLANVENIELTGSADTSATGNGADNLLTGNDGDNALSGRAGNDTLIGGEGADTLTGGIGDDIFVFDTLASGGSDIVTDFTGGEDNLAFDDAVFTALNGLSDLSTHLVAGTAAADADDFLIFDGSTGALYYDADGNGATESAIHIATLTGVSTLSDTDLSII